MTSHETWLKSWICALLHFTDFFRLNIHYSYILLEYSVKKRMRVIDIPYVTLSMHSKHIHDDMYIHDVTALQSAARGVSSSVSWHHVDKVWCELLVRAQARKAQGPIVFLRILFRAQARKTQGPIVFLRILFLGPKPERRRALLFSLGFFFLHLFFIDHPGIFGGLNMVKNS